MDKPKSFYEAQTRTLAQEAGYEKQVMATINNFVSVAESRAGRELTVEEYRDLCSHALDEWGF